MEGTSVNKPFWDLRDNEETVGSEGEIATVPPRISRRSGYRIDHLGCGRSRYALELMQTSVCAEGAETRDPDLELQTGRIWWSTRNSADGDNGTQAGKMSDSRHAETGARKTYRMVRYFFSGAVSRACLCISVPRMDRGLVFCSLAVSKLR